MWRPARSWRRLLARSHAGYDVVPMPNLDSGTERHCAAIGPADLQAVPTSRQHAIEEIRAAKLGVRPQPAGVRVGGRDWAGPAWILVDQIKLILHRALLDNDAPKLRGREPA